MFEGPVQDLIDELGKLPVIGPKSAQRIAFHLLSVEPPDIDRLTAVLNRVRDGVKFCAVCGNVSDDDRCRICSDARRDASLVCVVEEPKDVQAIERTREFRGRYHVLGGALDPLSGVGPEQLRIRELLNRIGERVDGVDVAEVIIATDPNTEGEATATYLVRMLRDIPGLTVTRTPEPVSSTCSTLVDSSTFTPSFLYCLSSSFETSASSVGTIRSRNSTIVTSTPKLVST